MKTISIALLALLAAPACTKKSDDATGAGVGAAKSTDKATPPAAPADPLAAALPKDMPPAFAAWDMPGRVKAWQGARLTEPSLGFKMAIDVEGTAMTQWDGKVEKKLEFALESPCSATFTEKSADGKSSSGTTTHFTVKNGELVQGLGDAGTRKGKSAIACVSNRILTLDDAGTCLSWTNFFHDWKSEPVKCGFVQDKGKEIFRATFDGIDWDLSIDGDVMTTDQLARDQSPHFADFAAAKAARDKK